MWVSSFVHYRADCVLTDDQFKRLGIKRRREEANLPIRTDPSASQTTSLSVSSLSLSPTPSSPNMKCNIIEGTYVNKKDKDYADFMIKCGMILLKAPVYNVPNAFILTCTSKAAHLPMPTR